MISTEILIISLNELKGSNSLLKQCDTKKFESYTNQNKLLLSIDFSCLLGEYDSDQEAEEEDQKNQKIEVFSFGLCKV